MSLNRKQTHSRNDKPTRMVRVYKKKYRFHTYFTQYRIHRIQALCFCLFHFTKTSSICNLLYQLWTSACTHKFIYFLNSCNWILKVRRKINKVNKTLTKQIWKCLVVMCLVTISESVCFLALK